MRPIKKIVIDQSSKRTPGLFKPEFVKCYSEVLPCSKWVQNKYSCKDVSKQHNDLHFQHYKDALDVFLKTRRDSELEGDDIGKARNVGFRAYDQGTVTYE